MLFLLGLAGCLGAARCLAGLAAWLAGLGWASAHFVWMNILSVPCC